MNGDFTATETDRTTSSPGRGYGFVNDPMDSETPDASSAAPRLYTQDSYKEDAGSTFLLPTEMIWPSCKVFSQENVEAVAAQCHVNDLD